MNDPGLRRAMFEDGWAKLQLGCKVFMTKWFVTGQEVASMKRRLMEFVGTDSYDEASVYDLDYWFHLWGENYGARCFMGEFPDGYLLAAAEKHQHEEEFWEELAGLNAFSRKVEKM